MHVPEGWKSKAVGDLVKFSGGSQPPRSTFIFKPMNGYVRLIQIRDYKTNKFATYVPTNLAKKFCKKDDIMIGRYGPPIFQILRGIEGAYNVALIKAIPTKGVINDYLFYFLKQDVLFRFIDCLSQRSSGQTGIEMDALNAYPFPLPSLPEQQIIAQILSTWDKATEKLETLIAAKLKRKKSLMQQLLTGTKRFPGFEEKWKYLKANELFKTISQKKNGGNDELLAVTQDQGVLPRRLLDRRVAMPDGSTEGYKLVEPGNFIISLRSFQGGLEYSNYRGLVSPAYTVLKPIKNISDDFYRHYFKSYEFIGHLAVAVIGIRDGKQISYEDFSFLKLPYPPIEEQKKIAAVLSTADKEIGAHQKQLIVLNEENRGLMQQLLTGKRRVKLTGIN